MDVLWVPGIDGTKGAVAPHVDARHRRFKITVFPLTYSAGHGYTTATQTIPQKRNVVFDHKRNMHTLWKKTKTGRHKEKNCPLSFSPEAMTADF